MFVTVIVCTRNRSECLRRAIESLFCSANLEVRDWELLVVENGSTDHTIEVCKELRRKFPRHFRFLIENRIGKCNALNTAVAAAKGEVLAFSDDDVLFAPDYVQSIRTVFDSFPADAAQGRVLLDCEGGWPEWLDEAYALMADHRDYGQELAPLNGTLCGSNMIVRKEVFDEVGGFAPELGPGGIGVFEDTEISLRMRDKGHRLIYAPQILVRHQWPRRRLTKSFIRKRMFLHGRINAFYDNLPASLPRFGVYVIKEVLSKKVQALWELCAGRSTAALHLECEALQHVGFFWQHCLFARGVPRAFSRGLLPGRLIDSQRGDRSRISTAKDAAACEAVIGDRTPDRAV
jgi:glycosyltransferase involved in cell wall biosynthesis